MSNMSRLTGRLLFCNLCYFEILADSRISEKYFEITVKSPLVVVRRLNQVGSVFIFKFWMITSMLLDRFGDKVKVDMLILKRAGSRRKEGEREFKDFFSEALLFWILAL